MTETAPRDPGPGPAGAPSPSPGRISGEKILFPGIFSGIDDLVEVCWAAVESALLRQGYRPLHTKIHLALHETLINAWQHGNCKRPDLPLIFRWRFAEAFTFEVLDAGQGFSCQPRGEPLSLDRLTAENGRGLAIIRFCADEIRWENHGSHAIVTFARP